MIKVVAIGLVGTAGMGAVSVPDTSSLERLGVGALTISLLVWLHVGEIRDRRETAKRRDEMDKARDERIAQAVSASASATIELAKAVRELKGG